MSCARVRLLVGQIAACLEIDAVERDCDWAENHCRNSRLIHVAIWQWEHDHEYVRDTVIPLLEKTRTAILAAAENMPDDVQKYFADFADNVAVRTANLKERYLKGLKSKIRLRDLLRLPSPSRRPKQPARNT